jgi:hypothetical protein
MMNASNFNELPNSSRLSCNTLVLTTDSSSSLLSKIISCPLEQIVAPVTHSTTHMDIAGKMSSQEVQPSATDTILGL